MRAVRGTNRAYQSMKLIWFIYPLLLGGFSSARAYKHDSDLPYDVIDSVVKALSLGDTNPEISIAVAKAHNQYTHSIEKGCKKYFSKIVNLGLPRTGTLSFIRVMEQNFGLRSCHQLPNNWPGYSDEIALWRKNPHKIKPKLKRALSQCLVFADIPNYSLYHSFDIRYPTARFVMTTRGLDSWLNSTEVLMRLWEGKMEKARILFIKKFFEVDGKLGWGREEYTATWLRHTRTVLEYFGNRILLLPIELSDSDKINALSAFTGCHPKYNSYAHSHESHRSSSSNHISQFSKKCLKYPKKCGF